MDATAPPLTPSVEMPKPLAGIRVIDCATIFAGPLIATMMADFGADVIKVEHPRGDSLRGHGPAKDGQGLFWKFVNRNKRAITLNLGVPEGRDLFLRLVKDADVLIENFRPGTMERWGLGWEVLHSLNRGLIMVRVTGFGQDGPYAHRPGFGTLAEAMSGFAYITGEADGPPTLPPFGLADGICGMAGTWAAAFALYHRDVHGGEGQFIDMAIYEPLMTVLGQQPIVFDQLGQIQQRMGNRTGGNSPRNTYLTADRRWVALSTSADSIAVRLLDIVGHHEVTLEPWFGRARTRAQHADQLDALVGDWIGARSLEEVLRVFDKAEVAAAAVYDTEQMMADPHVQYRQSITTVNDPSLGPVRMQNVVARLSDTPGSVRSVGPEIGADNESIYRQKLGISSEQMADLAARGVI